MDNPPTSIRIGDRSAFAEILAGIPTDLLDDAEGQFRAALAAVRAERASLQETSDGDRGVKGE